MNVERTGRPLSLLQVQLDSIRENKALQTRPSRKRKFYYIVSVALLVSTETYMMVTHDSILPVNSPFPPSSHPTLSP